MNQDYNLGIDTIVLGGSTDDTITIDLSDLDTDSDDTISQTDWNNPLSTTLTNGYAYSASLGTATSINNATVGATLTTTTGGSLLWNNPTYTATASPYASATGWTTYNNQAQVLKVSGDAEFEGDIKIKGVSMSDRLDAIEERLGILRPNNDLEGKWEKLKALGEEYRRLEKEILEGESIWDMLKK